MKCKKILMFLFIAGVSLLFSGCGGSNSPSDVVSSFCKSDFETSVQYILPAKQDAYKTKVNAFFTSFKATEMIKGYPANSFDNANVVSEKVNGDTAEVEVSHSADATLVFSLKKSGSNWYITGVGGLGEL